MATRFKLLTLAVAVFTLVAGVFFAVDTRAQADDNSVDATLNLFDAATGIRYLPGTAVTGSRGRLSRQGSDWQWQYSP